MAAARRGSSGGAAAGAARAAAARAAGVAKGYCLLSSFHGLRFLADSQRHWTERLFWLGCCLLSWYGSALLIRASWQAFQKNSISFATETNYIDWDTDFPAVAVCEMGNDNRIDFVRSQFEDEDKRNYDLDDVYKDIAYFRGQAKFIMNTCYKGDRFQPESNCPTSNFTEIARTYRTPCELIFGECKWNGKTFNCCDHFRPLPTEIGVCYAFNSVQSYPGRGPPLITHSNKKTGASTLLAEMKVVSTVYVLSRQEVPSMNTIERAKFLTMRGSHIYRWYSVKEVENDPQVRQTSARQRGCRFGDEVRGIGGAGAAYRQHSYSACVTQCRKREQQRLCGCASHQTPFIRPEEACDIQGLFCLNENYSRLSGLKPKGSTQDRLYCPCDLSCEDQEVKDTYGRMESISSSDVGIVQISIDRLPTVRFKRNVIRGKLDLVVSMGGTCGLLVGASLLSFVEVIYYFTLRVCGGNDDDNGSREEK